MISQDSIKKTPYHVIDLGEVKLDILDINKNFSQNTDALSSDGLHPSDGGVEILVQSFRDSFRGSDILMQTHVRLQPAPG